MKYSENTIRRKAHYIGYQVQKGFQHFHRNVFYDSAGKRHTGYMVKDLKTGFYEWGCYSENFDHLWDLDEVIEFLKGEYEALGLIW
ncbi:MAG: hypothetical protein Q4D15_04500 [Lachnospiraceae bacterium]|nr:hypothetical protein [Lachnospiraceae bacterium]